MVNPEVQISNDIEKCEEINIEFKKSNSSIKQIGTNGNLTLENMASEGCFRMLHKMVSNTLKHYKIDSVYSADDIMNIYDRHNMVNRFAKMATLDQDMRMLSSIIDFGEKPIHYLLNPSCKDDKLDGIKILDDGIIVPKKSKNSKSESVGKCIPKRLEDEQNKQRERIKELLYIPPRPNDKLEVITYGECSSGLRVDLPEENIERLQDRNLTTRELEETL